MKLPLKMITTLIMAITLNAGAAELPYLDAKVKTLVTFKDGTVFVLKEGQVKVGPEGQVVTAPIANAAFGTVGVTSRTKGVSVKMLTASAPAASINSAHSFTDARSNAHGRPVRILRRGSNAPITGELLRLQNPDSLAPQLGLPRVSKNTELVLSIKQADGVINLIPMSEVEECRFLDKESLDRDPDGTGQHLRITLDGAEAGQEVTIAYYYLWQGVRWTPSYILEREGDGRVRMELRGEIANRLLDLKHTELHLVVGVPNFMFVDTPSPMVAQKTLQQVTKVLQTTPNYSNDFARNVSFTQLTMNGLTANPAPIETRQPNATDPEFLPPAELPDASETDAGNLHLFKIVDVELAKGERTIAHLSTMRLKCRDLVIWDIDDIRVARADHSPSPQDRAKNPLVHYWMIKAGNTPLTTGPALVMKGEIALSQDQIYYTPRLSEGRFKMGSAVSVAGSASETVIAREPGSKEVKDKQSHYQGKPFWLMREIRWIDESRELTIRVKNSMAFETELQVTRQFSGRPEAHPELSMQTLGGMDDTKDQLNRLTWNITLKPGESRELKLRYQARVFTQP